MSAPIGAVSLPEPQAEPEPGTTASPTSTPAGPAPEDLPWCTRRSRIIRRELGVNLRRSQIAVAGCAVLVAVGAVLLRSGAVDAEAGAGPYVALGDSYTAGTFIPDPAGQPPGCGRSSRNYPALVAAALGAGPFTDVSCTAANTHVMTRAQTVPQGVNPPQVDAVSSETRLVTLGIGGNDVGLLPAITLCAQLAAREPAGNACRRHYAGAGPDSMVAAIEATAPKVAEVLRAIRSRSARARIIVVGYPAVLPRGGSGCFSERPLSPDDLAYLDGLEVRMNDMLARQAIAAGAEFADTYRDTTGHDACAPTGTRWVEGLQTTSPGFALHPNALGHQAMARTVVGVARAAPAPPGQSAAQAAGPGAAAGPAAVPGPVLSRLRPASRSIANGRAIRLTFRLDRAARVRLTLVRSVAGRRVRGVCRMTTRANRARPACLRRTTVRRWTVQGRAGSNAVAAGPVSYGRKPGSYRVTATPAAGASASVSVRVRR